MPWSRSLLSARLTFRNRRCARALWVILGFRPDRRSNVAAHPCQRPAMSGGERIEALARDSLARNSAARTGLSAHSLVHGPHRFEQRRLSRNRIETLDV